MKNFKNYYCSRVWLDGDHLISHESGISLEPVFLEDIISYDEVLEQPDRTNFLEVYDDNQEIIGYVVID